MAGPDQQNVADEAAGGSRKEEHQYCLLEGGMHAIDSP
jgi:hypothetical protein